MGYSYRDTLFSQDVKGSVHPPIVNQKFKKVNPIGGGVTPDTKALLPPFCLTSLTFCMQITLLTSLRRGRGRCLARATPSQIHFTG